MNIHNLDDLFLHELQETHAAEMLILGTLPKMVMRGSSADKPLDGCVIRTHERIRRLEQAFRLIDRRPDDSKLPASAIMMAEINAGTAAIADPKAHDSEVRSAVQTSRHYFLARYAMLASWARLLREPEPAKLLAATLEEAHASLLQPETVPPGRREPEQSKGASMGERLTALFDRRR
jgi:ferritin-like metal-binding protein YciE